MSNSIFAYKPPHFYDISKGASWVTNKCNIAQCAKYYILGHHFLNCFDVFKCELNENKKEPNFEVFGYKSIHHI